MADKSSWTYDYQAIADVTEQNVNTVQQHVSRKRREDPHYDMGDLRTLFMYLAAYGPMELRKEATLIMLTGDEKYREPHRGNKKKKKKGK